MFHRGEVSEPRDQKVHTSCRVYVETLKIGYKWRKKNICILHNVAVLPSHVAAGGGSDDDDGTTMILAVLNLLFKNNGKI